MPLTVGDLLRISGLDLELSAGARGAANPIRWVHVSELEDPTPWLKGGELLLTTGIGVGATAARQRRYVERLARAGLAGLGFGTGFSFKRVPKAVVDSADGAGFPVFEVPYPVPFIAITEAVFTRLMAEQYDLLSRSLDAEHTLTRSVLDGQGVQGIVSSLIHATGGWAVLLDLRGAAIAAAPHSARSRVPGLWGELQASRADGLRFSLSLVDRGDHVAVQPVSAQGRVEAYLALGKRHALTQFDRIVSSHALSLLALELTKVRAVSEAERRLKGDVLDGLLSGTLTPDQARRPLELLGFDLGKPVTVVAFAVSGPPAGKGVPGPAGSAGDAEALSYVVEETLALRTEPFLTSPRDGLVMTVLQPLGNGFLAALRTAIDGRTPGPVMAGAGSAVPFDQLVQGVREARYALEVCRTEGRPQAEFGDLGTYQLLLSLQEPEALRAFSASVLAPLDAYDAHHGGELIPSLRAFIERNARWEAAAAELYVHRHTLRYRMRKVEELTGRDLSSARDRMEFFLALRARDLLSTSRSLGTGKTREARPRGQR